MRKKGSLTVEASLLMPVFIMAMVLVAYFGQLAKCQDEVQWALTRIATEASAEYGASGSEVMKSAPYYMAKMSAYLSGSGISISFLESEYMEENDEIDLIVNYKVKLPFSLGNRITCHFRQRVHTRAFTGVESRGDTDEREKEDVTVYITDTGRVYHRNHECTYLKLSISKVYYSDLKNLRNSGGGKYKACERCSEKELTSQTPVWITNYGDRYHTSKGCSGIKRGVEEIKLSEVGNRTPCSKCGREDE